MANDVFTCGQIAKMCCAATRTVSKWIDSGVIKGYRLPPARSKIANCQGSRRVHIDDLRIFFARHSIPSSFLQNPPKKEDVLTTGKAAEICRTTATTVGRWIDKGILTGWRLPNSKDRRVHVNDLRRFMQANGLPVQCLDEYLKTKVPV